MNKERLLDLADRLETVPEEHFSLATWGDWTFIDIVRNTNPFPGWSPMDELSNRPEGSCGTAACACGYLAIFHPHLWFYDDVGMLTYRDPNTSELHDVRGNAVETYFNITTSQQARLFQEGSFWYRDINTITPMIVADQIRQFVAEQE